MSVQRNSHAVIPPNHPGTPPSLCQCRGGLQPSKKPIKVQTAAAIPLTSCRSHCMLLTAYPKKVDHVEHEVISPHQLSSSGLPIATCVHLKRLSATCQHQNLVHCCCESHWTENLHMLPSQKTQKHVDCLVPQLPPQLPWPTAIAVAEPAFVHCLGLRVHTVGFQKSSPSRSNMGMRFGIWQLWASHLASPRW